MTERLEGRIAVVTGGANGIGRACCVRFAEEGADIVVADLLDMQETIALVKERGREALAVQLDAASRDDNEAMAAAALERFGRVDVLVTAAGISHADYVSGDLSREEQLLGDAARRLNEPWKTLTDLEVGAWQKVLDVNLTGTFLAIKAISPSMIEAKSGSIVTIASVAAKRPDAGPIAYTVSKAGVWMLTKSLARHFGPAGIRVNAIGPGFIDTHMTALITKQPAITEMFLQQIPLRRLGQPIDVANTALFLASDESSYFTGEILHPDGGYFTE